MRQPGADGAVLAVSRQRAAIESRARHARVHGEGCRCSDFADTLQVFQGSLYVNDFNLFGRTWQVIVQADQEFRDQVEDIPKLQVRNCERRDGAAWVRWPTFAKSTARWC